MNIFFLHRSASIAAQLQCDRHVVKMILETAQLLSTAQHEYSTAAAEHVYKPTHRNHPCSVWVRASSSHYAWTVLHLESLLSEYTRRYHKTHKTQSLCEYLLEPPMLASGWSDPPLCMPDEYKQDDPVLSYRAYYASKDRDWTKAGRGMTYRSPAVRPDFLSPTDFSEGV